MIIEEEEIEGNDEIEFEEDEVDPVCEEYCDLLEENEGTDPPTPIVKAQMYAQTDASAQFWWWFQKDFEVSHVKKGHVTPIQNQG